MKSFYCSVLIATIVLIGVALVNSEIVDPKTDSTTTTTATPTSTKKKTTTTIVSTTSTTTKTSSTTTNTTTTTHSTTTTIAPTTIKPSPTAQEFIVNDSSGVCIVMKAAIRMIFNYTVAATNKTKQQETEIPQEFNVSGSCGKESQTMMITFYDTWKLSLTFSRNNSLYYMSQLMLHYDIHTGSHPFPGAKSTSGNVTGKPQDSIETKINTSYLCMAQRPAIDKGQVQGLMKITFSDFQVEAFRTSNTTSMNNYGTRCKSDEVSNLVPIVVGAALGGLILIVLIAYIIGRKRSRRGYESV